MDTHTHAHTTGHMLTVEETGGLANLADVPEARGSLGSQFSGPGILKIVFSGPLWACLVALN